MINPPAIKYYGDTAKANALKGVALQFYQSVCMQLGAATTLTREKRTAIGGQAAIIKASIFLNSYRKINGRIDVFVQPILAEEGAKLFCTSFNDDDLGTQVYKTPYPPKTQGELITIGDNPNLLVLPSPTYSARTNCWVDDKEKNTVSWDYVEYLNTDFPVGSPSRNKKYGKIAIQGIETGIAWGLYLSPICCALIPAPDDTPGQQQLVIIYTDKVNYSGTGTNKYVGVYDYVLNFASGELELSEVDTPIDFTTDFAAPIKALIGFFGDSKRLAVRSSVARTYYPDDWPGGIVVNPTTINVLEFNANYSAILSNDIIYETKPYVSLDYNYDFSGDVETGASKTLISPVENLSVQFIDVRGKYISFAVDNLISSNRTWQETQGDFFVYKPYDSSSTSTQNNIVFWSTEGGLVRNLFYTSTYSSSETGTLNEFNDDVRYDGSVTEEYIYISVFSKNINEVIYSEVNKFRVSSEWLYSGEGSSSQSISMSVKSKKNGVLYTSNNSLGGDGIVTDYSYTKNVIIASIEAFDYDQFNFIDKSFTFIGSKKGKNIIQSVLKTISVTKLPQATS